MNTLQQIENLLLPIWNKLYKENPNNIPKSFVKLMTYTIPKYKDNNFDSFFGKLNRRLVILSLRKAQIDLLKLNLLDKEQTKYLNIFANGFLQNIKKIKGDKSFYEVGPYIDDGMFSLLFRLRYPPNLLVKIRKNNLQYNKGSKKVLEEELKKNRVLIKLGISVPKCIAVIPVKFPEYFDKTLKKNKVLAYFKKNLLSNLAGEIRWGLVMEYVEQDLTLISSERLAYLYKKETEKVKKLGITIPDLGPNKNVLWSKSMARIYLIDFDDWVFPKKFEI